MNFFIFFTGNKPKKPLIQQQQQQDKYVNFPIHLNHQFMDVKFMSPSKNKFKKKLLVIRRLQGISQQLKQQKLNTREQHRNVLFKAPSNQAIHQFSPRRFNRVVSLKMNKHALKLNLTEIHYQKSNGTERIS